MRFFCVVIFLVFVVNIDGGSVWLKDLTSPNGLDLGYGVTLKLNESKKGKNVPITDRLSLGLNFNDVGGVSLSNPRSDGVELDLYLNKAMDSNGEGRSKKDGGKHMMQMMIGYKAALMTSIGFAIMKVLSMKAIFLAKVAIIISLFALLIKFKDNRSSEIIEVEQHGYPSHGHYGEHPVGYHLPQAFGGGYYSHYGYGREAQPSNLYSEIVYAPSATEADNNGVYSAVVPNGSIVQAGNARNGQEIEKTKDKSHYRKHKGSSSARSNLLSVNNYALSTEV